LVVRVVGHLARDPGLRVREARSPDHHWAELVNGQDDSSSRCSSGAVSWSGASSSGRTALSS